MRKSGVSDSHKLVVSYSYHHCVANRCIMINLELAVTAVVCYVQLLKLRLVSSFYHFVYTPALQLKMMV